MVMGSHQPRHHQNIWMLSFYMLEKKRSILEQIIRFFIKSLFGMPNSAKTAAGFDGSIKF